jgi:hypothetical protein
MTRTLLCVLGLTLLGGATRAAEPAVMRVLVVQPTDLKTYVHELGLAQGLLNKAGMNVRVRVWQAQFAGEHAGTIAVSLEFANLAEMARYYELGHSNPEMAAELAKIAVLRKVVSESLYQDVGP